MRKVLTVVALLVAAGLAPAQAQDYPNRPVRFVVGYAAGGGLDALARIVADRLAKPLGQRVNVENRAGGGGNIASEAVATAPPDGYTMLFHDTAMMIAPAAYATLAWDPVKSFQPVSQICIVTLMLVGAPNLPANNMAELIALLRANPDKYNYAIPGIGTVHHLAGEMFARLAQVKITSVPYRGAAPALTDLMGGHIPLAMASAAAALPHGRAGKLKMIGVTSAARSPSAPDIPAFAEVLPGLDASPTIFVVAPAGTPMPIVTRMEQALKSVLAEKEVQDLYAAQGAVVAPSTPVELGRTIADGVQKWSQVAREAGVKLD